MQTVDLAGNVTKTPAEFPLWQRSAVGRQRKQRVGRFRVVPCFDEGLVDGSGRPLPVIDGFRQAAFAASRLPWSQVSDHPRALPGAADQNIKLPPGQSQRLGRCVGGPMPD